MRVLVLLLLVLFTTSCIPIAPPTPPLITTPAPTPTPKTEPMPVVTEPAPVVTEIEPTPAPVHLSYESRGYVKQVKGTETFTMKIGDKESSKTQVGYLTVACVEVKNTDTVGGIFTVCFNNVAKPTFAEISLKRALALKPGETGTAECPADELGDWNFTVSPSTKQQ